MIEYFGHPFSSYTWKGEIALIEKGADYVFRPLGPDQPDNQAALDRHSAAGKFPLLVDGGRALFEASIIAEYVDHRFGGGPRLIPQEFDAALRVRLLDRVFDNHVMANMQAVVNEHLPFLTPAPDPARVERARAALTRIYGWLERELPADGWACGADFTLADCAAAPSLFYADWAHPIPDAHAKLKAYRARLLARPSVAQVVEAARPYRAYFPLGAPDRD